LNALARGQEVEQFHYKPLGSLAYIGARESGTSPVHAMRVKPVGSLLMTFSSIGSAGTPWRVQLWRVHHLVCLALGVPRQAGTCAWTNLGCVVVDEESDIQTVQTHR
jgi:hypothetical protein